MGIMDAPFRYLSDAEYQTLSPREKIAYLHRAIEHQNSIDEALAARITALGEQVAKEAPRKLHRSR